MMCTGFEVVFDGGNVKQKKRLSFVEFESPWQDESKPQKDNLDKRNST